MTLHNIQSHKELLDINTQKDHTFLLLYKSGTEQSDCAKQQLDGFDGDENNMLFGADVREVKDIHTVYGIASAPSLLEFRKGKLVNVVKGCHSEQYYASLIKGNAFTSIRNEEGKPAKRVTVYTTPTCTWCNTLKTYFKENNINFTEVDVASNHSKAEEMVKKSGQQGVPQTEINGQMIVGFDKVRLNQLLDIN